MHSAAETNLHLDQIFPARIAAQEALPWIPLSPDKAFKPLRFLRDNRGFVELLRIDPGSGLGLHRHTGEVHAFNLEGSRRLGSGELIGPGDYVYEPAGNIDSWSVEGEKSLVVLVIVMGAVEYLDAEHRVTACFDADRLLKIYRDHCVAHGIDALELVD